MPMPIDAAVRMLDLLERSTPGFHILLLAAHLKNMYGPLPIAARLVERLVDR
jgi:hypothetical protein